MSTWTKTLFASIVGLLLCVSSIQATHIVGGELEVEHIQDSTYMLRGILYFDAVNGSSGARDNSITVHIFNKATDALMVSHVIDLTSVTNVEYTDPDCAVAALETERMLYEQEVILDPAIYTEPEGYYLVWERCCRNGVIDNIVDPDSAGMTFYLEFPPVVKDGDRFINSTPTIFPPLSDFACVDFPYYVDFRGSDKDGDSLVYSLSHPLNGNATAFDPIPSTPIPAPYAEVTFESGYSVTNQILGTPSLGIDDVGFLTVTPDTTGLFVFAVKCEEFRDGVKIGEVRRDFQMLVLDCPEYFFPEITDVNFAPDSGYNQTDTITYFYNEDSPCLSLTVKDFEVSSEITAEIRPLNFSVDDVTLSPTSGTLSGPNDSLQLQLCLPGCPAEDENILAFEVIVKDNSCALPLMDTATFYVNVVPVPNDAPEVDLSIPFNVDSGYYYAEVELGNLLEFDISAFDINGDSLLLELVDSATVIAELSALGNFNFTSSLGDSTTSSGFSWEPCSDFPSDTAEWLFPIQFTAIDRHECQGYGEPDTVDVLIRVYHDPPSTTVEVSPLQFDAGANTYYAEINTNELLTLDVIGKSEGGNIDLIGLPNGFTFEDLGILFNPVQGGDSVYSEFNWEPSCEVLDGNQSGVFEVAFVVNSIETCSGLPYTDTLEVEIRVNYVPLPNEAPALTSSLSDADTIVCDTLYLGENISFDVIADDIDGHFMTLIGQGRDFDLADYGIVFDELTGFGSLSQTFEFDVSCNAADYPNPSSTQEELIIDFIVEDSSDCFVRDYDTLSVKLLLIKELSPNNAPSISADLSNFDAATVTYTVDAVVGDVVTFTLTGIDSDALDNITITGTGHGFELANMNMDFTSVTGTSPVTTTFTWVVDCRYLNDDFTARTYRLHFQIEDGTKNCDVTNLDVANVLINVSDVAQPEFNPANAFSPNDDGIGDEYYISSLPLDDCTDTFIGIKIYSRWGKLVYESTDRNFKWDGLKVSAGIYFYEIQYENSMYKGTVHVLKK